EIEYYTLVVYGYLMMFVGPLNIVANILSAALLLTKELRNPFNVILCLMCLDPVVPLLLRVSMVYRNLGMTECSETSVTYSLALHSMIELFSWPI
ncbi:hypothetical protein PMAYCL1PPCAC_21425, partial [Pristionchus mayeri]